MFRLTLLFIIFAVAGLLAQPVSNNLDNLPIVYVNAAPIDENGEPELFALPMLPGSACDLCYKITRSSKNFVVSREPAEGCEVFKFTPTKAYRGNTLDYVHIVSTGAAGCERNELYVVFFWNPNYYKGVVSDPEVQGVCGIPGLKMTCSGGPSPACNLVCNPGFGGYDFFAPNTLNAGVVPGWKAAQGQPAQTCQSLLGLNSGALNLWRTNDEVGAAAYTNLRPGPAAPRLYLLTYTRACVGGNNTLREFRTVLTEGLEPESVFDIGTDPRITGGRLLFSDEYIQSSASAQRVAVLTTLPRAPKQLLLMPRQGRPYQNLLTRTVVDQVELVPFPLVDSTTVRTVRCDTALELRAPAVCINSGSRWEWYNGSTLVGLGDVYRTPPVQSTDQYRVCLNPQAQLQHGGQLCYPFRLNITGNCNNACSDFRTALQVGGGQIRVDTSGNVAVRFFPPAGVASADRVEWDFGCDNSIEYTTNGQEPLALNTVPNGNIVCLNVLRNVNGVACAVRLVSNVTVPVKAAVCACSSLPAEAIKSFSWVANGNQSVTFTPRGQLSSTCDVVRWDFGDYAAPVYSRGKESVTYRYPLPKGFQACMSIVRTDPATGKQCSPARWCRSIWPMHADGGADDRSEPASLTAFLSPNPATEVVTIRLSGLAEHPAQMTITDVLGRTLVQNVDLTGDDLTLPVGGWNAGVYRVQIRNAEGRMLVSEKLVKI